MGLPPPLHHHHQLLPADPAGKAAARLIIQRFSDKAVPAFYRMLVQQDKDVQAAAASALDTELQVMNPEQDRPIFCGAYVYFSM